MTQTFKTFLHDRKIPDASLEKYHLSGDDQKLVIPIRDKKGNHLFNKYRILNPKQYLYDKGSKASLFGSEFITGNWCVLCEGELDAIRTDSIGIPAVSGTGGCGTFDESWELPKLVVICYDTDTAGKEASLKVHHLIPNSRILNLPEGKDVTEYLMNHTKEDFLELIKQSVTVPKEIKEVQFTRIQSTSTDEMERAKEYPIEELLQFGHDKKAKCIWHNEKSGSLHLYPTNKVYCFGCSKGGDAIDVYMALHNVPIKEAITYLANN